MSRHRIKNIDYEDDDYAENDEGDYAEDTEISPEDREQMKLKTVEVQQLLQSEIPPVLASEEEIWESLWHYYYDVDKTVTYIRRKKRGAESKKEVKKKTPTDTPAGGKSKKNGNGIPPKYPLPATQHQGFPCSAQPSAHDFFRDSPWLNVPIHRKADILIEPLYPRLGLLGGSGEGTGKMSKLAALAAARKKKESEKQASREGARENESSSTKPSEDQRSKSISLLDRLATNGSAPSSSAPRTTKFPLRRGIRDLNGRDEQKAPESPAEPAKPEHKEEPPKAESPPQPEEREEKPSPGANLKAEPSTFAATIVGEKGDPETTHPNYRPQSFDFLNLIVQNFTEVFNFTEPSPDDVVLNARSAAGGNKTKRTGQQSTKSQADLTENVKQLSVQEKIKSKNLDVLAEHRKAKRKKAANFVVIGHVDAGKSTLMGRLLFDLKAVDQRTLDKYRREADKIGKGSFALAWVLDQGTEERARGVTIDIAANKFETEGTSFTILDAPGHRDFVPNMIAGASQADFALLVVDASTGNFESGLKGQTKEHALLVRSMGVQKIVVAVNKMDSADWSKDRFDEIEQQISSFLITAGFQAKNISFVPCSGLRGDNVTQRTDSKNAAWYTGKTLIGELEVSEPYSYALEKPLRMTISDIFRGGVQNPLSISGRLDAGSLQMGDRITIMPSGETAVIKSLEVDQEPRDWAVAGQNVVLNLMDIDPIHLKTGDIICSPTSPIQNITSFTAKVLAFDHLTPMHIDVHRGRLHVPGRISKLVATLDKGSGAPLKKKPKIVAPGTVARVVVEIDQSIPLESPARVVLRAGGETVAAGLLE